MSAIWNVIINFSLIFLINLLYLDAIILILSIKIVIIQLLGPDRKINMLR